MSDLAPETEFALGEPAVKLAETSAPVHDLIRKRWSPRSFSDRPVSDRDLRSLLEAARWAPSSGNEQPWRFFLARRADAEAFNRLFQLLVPGNQAWAGAAAVLMLMAAKTTSGNTGNPNPYALHDAGQAFAQLSLQAVALGIHVHGMAGFDHQRARAELRLPDDHEWAAAAAIGYVGSPDALSEKHRILETSRRRRKPLEELIFGAGWDTQFRLPE
jgi:nitroreductase